MSMNLTVTTFHELEMWVDAFMKPKGLSLMFLIGDPGHSKSFSIKQLLDVDQHRYFKCGRLTAFQLYKQLFKHRDRAIILDDRASSVAVRPTHGRGRGATFGTATSLRSAPACTQASSKWLAKPTCNEVLSNKGWICKSITHKIEAGKYTTTIGVYLTAPGVDSPPNTPLGSWTGGWHPTPQC